MHNRFLTPAIWLVAIVVPLLASFTPASSAQTDHRIPFGAGRAFYHPPRYHEYQLDNVKIVVSFDEKAGNVTGDATNTVTITHANTTFVDFDSADLHYSWVGMPGGAVLRHETFGQTLRVFLPKALAPGETVAVEARYTAHPTKGLYFVRPDASYPDRPWEVWSQGEMIDNHFWFPTYDWPDIKAASETVVTVPEGQTVVSNGKLARITHDAKSHTVTYDWVEPIPHSTYLISLVAGTFAQWTDHLGSLPVTYYAPPKYRETVAYDFRATPKMIDFFSKFNGVTYPYDKYAQSAVVDFTYGGMENISATTQTSGTLHDHRSELDDDSEGLVAHELAHQWWGDLETMQDWGQVWLNEGYATYYEALYREHAHGEDAFDMDRRGMMQDVFDGDQRYRRPIVTEVYYDPIDLFDAEAYPKAALVLHMARNVLGTDVYRKSQTAFLKQFAGKNTNTAQWEASVEQTTGTNLAWFVDEWLYQAGFPEYSVAYTYDAAAHAIHLSIDQTQATKWNTPAVFVMPIVIETKTQDGATVRTTIHNDRRHQTYDIPCAGKPIMVLFDPGHNVLSKVTFKKSDADLLYQMNDAESVLDRLDAADALIARAKPTDAEINDAAWFLRHERFADGRAAVVDAFSKLAPDERAAGALRLALTDPSAHVRAAAADAMRKFKPDPLTVAALKARAASDPSYMTVAAAVESLSDLHAPGIQGVLARALDQPSNNAEIASAALYGYAKVERRNAIPLEERYARYGAPLDSRNAAIRALGRAGRGDPAVTGFLTGLLGDPNLRTNFVILASLTNLSDAAALPAVRHLEVTTEDERLRAAARETIASIEAQQHASKKKGPAHGS